MSTTTGRRRGRLVAVDQGAIALGRLPQQTMRILAMVRGGHTIPHIIEVGAYHRSWTSTDVARVLKANGVVPPGFGLDEVAPLPGRRVELPSAMHVAICEQVCRGLSNSEVAEVLGLAESTVKTCLRVIIERMEARHRLDLVVGVLTGRMHAATGDGEDDTR